MSGGIGRRTRLRRVAITLAVSAIALAAGFAPRTLRDVEAFRVERVEVVGTRYLDPYDVVRAAGLGPSSSVFDDADAWRSGVMTLPLVEHVEVRRTLPASLTVEVREVEPVALVADGALRPVDRHGRVLELDPAGVALDLPIVTGVELEGRNLEGDGVLALRTLAALSARSRALAASVSQVEVLPRSLRLVLREEALDALLPLRPTPTQIDQLQVTLADLAARGELERVHRIDVRFRDQIVVSFLDSPKSS